MPELELGGYDEAHLAYLACVMPFPNDDHRCREYLAQKAMDKRLQRREQDGDDGLIQLPMSLAQAMQRPSSRDKVYRDVNEQIRHHIMASQILNWLYLFDRAGRPISVRQALWLAEGYYKQHELLGAKVPHSQTRTSRTLLTHRTFTIT